MLRESVWLCLAALQVLSVESLQANAIWLHETIVSDFDGLVVTTQVRYWFDGSRVDYEFELTNQTGEDV